MRSSRATTRLGNVWIAYEKDSFTRDGWDVVPARIEALKRSQLAAFNLPQFKDAVISLSVDQQGCAGVIVPGAAAGGGNPHEPVVIRDEAREDPGGLFGKIADHLWERVVYS